MNQDLGLRLLGQIMAWTDERARAEFEWIRLMSRLKYDSYEDFRAGVRFVERLCVWLQQFDQPDRETAYGFVKDRLVYIGPAEMQILVDRFYIDVVERHLLRTIAEAAAIPSYKVWSTASAAASLKQRRRTLLFMGLSDGARIDEFRRANTGILSNEQIVVATQLDASKWRDLLKELRRDVGAGSVFSAIYLIDDFVASGTTMLRRDVESNVWKGKLIRFRETLDEALRSMDGESILSADWSLHVHHYIATSLAAEALHKRLTEAAETPSQEWLRSVSLSFGTVLPPDLPLNEDSSDPFCQLVKRYYDPTIENRHSAVSGEMSLMWGYRKCGLPLVFEHNTPNNSLPILWAETDGDPEKKIHAMRPLFRRRQRHS